jgi:hypothetical protein
MSDCHFGVYLAMLRAWLQSSFGLDIQQCIKYARETARLLNYIDVGSPRGALILNLTEGLIVFGHPHAENGSRPIMTPVEAVDLAISLSSSGEMMDDIPASWEQVQAEWIAGGVEPVDDGQEPFPDSSNVFLINLGR